MDNLEEKLIGGSMISTQERQRCSSSLSHFSFDYKTVADLVLGAESSHPPVSKPHKCPVLRNHLLSITLPLAEFFMCLNINQQSSSEHLPLPKCHPRVSVSQISHVNKIEEGV